MSSGDSFPIQRFSTAGLPPEQRYEAWLSGDWPRFGQVFRTTPTEPFDTVMEVTALGRLMFARARISAMTWERNAQDIRAQSFDPIIVNMMIQGEAHGDMDGRSFREPAGTYHFHDLARPSLHDSTASLTYSLVIPRDLAADWFAPLADLHGLVVGGEAARAAMDLAETAWLLLPGLGPTARNRFERALLELVAAGCEASRPTAPARSTPEAILRALVVHFIDQPLGLERATPTELCRTLGVSVGELGAAFRGDGGLKTYLLHRRLEMARMALTSRRRTESIGAIAHRLGFSDASHLSRAFRRRYEVTPRDYRRLAEA